MNPGSKLTSNSVRFCSENKSKPLNIFLKFKCILLKESEYFMVKWEQICWLALYSEM